MQLEIVLTIAGIEVVLYECRDCRSALRVQLEVVLMIAGTEVVIYDCRDRIRRSVKTVITRRQM